MRGIPGWGSSQSERHPRMRGIPRVRGTQGKGVLQSGGHPKVEGYHRVRVIP